MKILPLTFAAITSALFNTVAFGITSDGTTGSCDLSIYSAQEKAGTTVDVKDISYKAKPRSKNENKNNQLKKTTCTADLSMINDGISDNTNSGIDISYKDTATNNTYTSVADITYKNDKADSTQSVGNLSYNTPTGDRTYDSARTKGYESESARAYDSLGTSTNVPTRAYSYSTGDTRGYEYSRSQDYTSGGRSDDYPPRGFDSEQARDYRDYRDYSESNGSYNCGCNPASFRRDRDYDKVTGPYNSARGSLYRTSQVPCRNACGISCRGNMLCN